MTETLELRENVLWVDISPSRECQRVGHEHVARTKAEVHRVRAAAAFQGHDPGARMFTNSRAIQRAAIADTPVLLREVLDAAAISVGANAPGMSSGNNGASTRGATAVTPSNRTRTLRLASSPQNDSYLSS